jgi:hypothetical protein
MEQVTVIWVSLVGFGMLISFLVGILKYFGVVKDGTADKWVAGFNLLGMIFVFIAINFFPQLNLPAIDQNILSLVGVLNIIWSYVLTLFGSKIAYWLSRGLPVIGKSFSLDENTKKSTR